MKTPRLTHHARERCAEMEVPTKHAKRVVQHPDLTRPAKNDATMALADDYPEIAVVYCMEGDQPIITTVVWRTYETYDRKTYRP